MFKQYLSRSESYENNESLIFTFLIGAVLITSACFIMGCVMLHFYRKRLHGSLRKIYMPFGLFFLTLSLVKTLEIVSFWHNYAWLVGYANDLCGFFAVWTMFELPKAITHRVAQSLFADMQAEKEDWNRKIEELKELKKFKNVQ